MFKFIKNKGPQSTMDCSKLQEDFFSFTKLMPLGFPHKPSSLAWDPIICLMAIGTQNGSLRLYGAPGVQFYGHHKKKCNVANLLFIPNKGSLISHCVDNTLHLWELNEINKKWELQEVKSFTLEGQMKKITTIFLNSAANTLFMGTVCGNIYTLDISTFETAESVIYQDVVMQNIPDDKKISQGAVKIINEQPGNPDCLLIGYHQGLLVLWNLKTLIVESTFLGNQNLESVAWHSSGTQFMSSHSDGSYVTWSTSDPSKPVEVPITPYGPFSCKAISKINWKSVKGGDDYIIFSGGMPRASHGEKHTVTIMCGDKHQVLDLTSNVIDFFTVSDVFDESDFDNPHSLIVLVEEELLAIDLESDAWLPFYLPYLDSPHSSPITCVQLCSNVHKDFWKQIVNLSRNNSENYSENVWPITGGICLVDSSLNHKLLVTGHEDGSIKLWNVSNNSMQIMYMFHTANIFNTYEHDEDASDDIEEWPPFRKLGNFDPYNDDPRLAIRKLVINDITRTLIVGGSAGQILVLQMLDIDAEKDTKVTMVHFVGEWDSFLWKGHPPLTVKSGSRTYKKGYHLQCLIQVTPPTAITALAFHAEWNLIAAGTSHGLLLFDIIQKKCVMSKCTVSIGDITISSGDISPKSRSLKKSLRESFRKLRKGKSQWQRKERTGSLSSELQKDSSRENSIQRDSIASSPDPTIASSPSPELLPFHSETDPYSTDDVLNSVVHCVYFAQSFIINNVITTPTLWAGTSKGCVFIFTISMPSNEGRTSDCVTCQLGKEIQLKHHAPVLAIQIVDHRGYPLPDPIDIQYQRAKPADLCGSHRVLICSEEQLKVFTLPSMKPFCKYKIAAMEGCHISKVGFSGFQCKSDAKYTEYCVMCLSNTGEISLYTIPDLRRLVSYQYSGQEEINTLSCLLFTNDGHSIHLTSPSEFEMVSFSALLVMQPVCKVELPEDARIVPNQRNDIVIEMQKSLSDEKIRIDNKTQSMESAESKEEESKAEDPVDIHEREKIAENGIEAQDTLAETAEAASSELSLNQVEEQAPNNTDTVDSPFHSGSSNPTLDQVKRAPIARIEELNTAEELHMNFSNNFSRTSYC